MTKIRFLATGDIHSQEEFVKYITSRNNLSKIDFIVMIGDISEKKDDYNKLLRHFKNKQIFMIPGNHESIKKLERLKQHYNVHLIGNSPIRINDKIAIFGTNYSNIGPHGIAEEDVFHNLVKNHEAIKDIKFKIHVSHIPPAETKISNMSPFYPFISGSHAQRVFLENFTPNISLVGHIHESSGLEEIVNKTKVINVGRTFKVFEFDLEKEELIEK